MSKKKSTIWSFFSSVRLAIVLLLIIALIAMIGTLFPQREAAAELAGRIPPGLFSFLQKMQIFDLYHSVWFILLMGLLAVNLLICSLNRFPAAWNRFRSSPIPRDPDAFKDLGEENLFYPESDVKKATDAATHLLKKKYHSFKQADEKGSVYLCAQKGRFAHFGVYMVHLSILGFICGAVIGSVSGIDGSVKILEGETISVIGLRNGGKMMPLPFSVRCDKFTLERYKNGAPRIFQSDLTFIKNDRAVRSVKLLVNHPVVFEGFHFYQASYGSVTGKKATLALLRDGGRRDIVNVSAGYTFDLPGKEGIFKVLRVEDNMMQMGPAIKIAVHSEKEAATFWVFRDIDRIRQVIPDVSERVPVFNPGLFRPYTFSLLEIEKKYYTGLQVNRDPGTPVVAAAAVLLISGLMIIIFSYARQIWIRIDQDDGRVRIGIAGRSIKNKVGLKHEVRYLLAQLKDNLENPK
ncbi:MAG: cytochrome c biogenesis protein ResB [Smithellaceae bacterium]|nr:cytochrome c biogenesis protein ResB [Smithellaceae bacterium]